MKIKKTRNYGKNLGKYLHPTKLPKSGVTIGKPTVKKPSRRKIKRMSTTLTKGY
jgi:hypothetical protein